MLDWTPQPPYTAEQLLQVIRILRDPENGCPWDKVQTHASIRKNFLEETCEALEAIDADDAVLLREELGDVLMQVVFHAAMEEERGRFTFEDVCRNVCEKLVFRHPDVGGIHDALQHRDAAGVSAQRLDAARLRTAHGAEHTPGQRVAGQGLQHAAVRGVDGSIGAAGQHARGGAVDLAALHQKGERFAPGVQRRADDLGAFGDEDTLFGLQLIAQLGLGEPGVRSQLGGG